MLLWHGTEARLWHYLWFQEYSVYFTCQIKFKLLKQLFQSVCERVAGGLPKNCGPCVGERITVTALFHLTCCWWAVAILSLYRMLLSKCSLVDIQAVEIRCRLYMHRVVKRTGINHKKPQSWEEGATVVSCGCRSQLYMIYKGFGVFFVSRHRSI